MTLDEKFTEIMQSNTGCAVIMAGSDSDEPHIERIAKSLEEWEIPYRVRICSAHKQPDLLKRMIWEYNEVGGSYCIIAIAGGTDALSGTASYHAYAPVISCPPGDGEDKKPDANNPNMSCLTNPPGSSNAYVVRANNVAKFIAQIYAGVNPGFRESLEWKTSDKIAKLVKKDAEFQAKYMGDGKC